MAIKNPDLFAGQSQRIRRLHAQSKKALRERARKRWWDNNGKDKPHER